MRDDIEYRTYQYVRLGMLAVVVTLGISVFWEARTADWCLQRSISAYYYTPVQPVFVGALIALCLAMIAIWGRNAVEDAALSLAGLLAPVVAFVPTSDANACSVPAAETAAVSGSSTIEDRETAEIDDVINRTQDAIDNNLLALAAVVIIGLAVVAIRTRRSRATVQLQPGTKVVYRGTWILTLALLVTGGILRLSAEGFFFSKGHFLSAASMFLFVIVVAFANHFEDKRQAKTYGVPRWVPGWLRRTWGQVSGRAYALVGWAMIVAIVVLVGSRFLFDFSHWVLVLEAILIGLFGVFWLIQTIRLEHEAPPGRPEAAGPPVGSAAPVPTKEPVAPGPGAGA